MSELPTDAAEARELMERLQYLEATMAARDQEALELSEPFKDLEAENAQQGREIIRLGNLPPPTVMTTGSTTNPAAGNQFAGLPPLPAGGSTPPATPPAVSRANIPAPQTSGGTNVVVQQAQGGAMPPMPTMGNIIMNDRTWEAWTGGAPKLNWTELVDPNQIPLPT